MAIALVLNWLYGTLEEFERHTPRQAIVGYFTQLKSGDREPLKANAGFEPDDFSGWDDYFAILDERFERVDPGNISWRQSVSAELAPGEELYAIYDGEDRLGEVILAPSETTESGWVVRSEVSYLPGYTIASMPAGAQVYENGILMENPGGAAVDPVLISYERDGRPVEVDIFSTLSEENLIPRVSAPFETPQTLAEPEFTATDWNGNPCDVVVDRDARTVTVTVPTPAEDTQALAAYMEEVAHMYSDFITYEYKGAGLGMLLPYVYENSSLYNDFKEYQAFWYRDHESREFSESAFSDIVLHSNECFTGHIEFTVTIVRLGVVHVFEPSYDMAFVLVDGEWKLAGLHARRAEVQDTAA